MGEDQTNPAAPNRADGDALGHVARYQLGVIGLELRSDSRRAVREYDRYYAEFRCASHATDPIVVDVRRSASRWRRNQRFDVSSNGRPRSSFRSAADVPPHVDWAVNWAIGLDRGEYFQVHAAVLSRGAMGVVLAGASGSGKSTLAAALLLSGWGYLGDEFALLDPDDGRLLAFPKALCLKQPSWKLLRSACGLSGLRACCRRRAEGPVALLPARRVRGDAIATSAMPRLLVFPAARTGGAPRARPITPADALMRLARLSFNFFSYGARGLEVLERLVRSAPAYELAAGELRATVRLLGELFDDALAALREDAPMRVPA